MTEHRTRAFAGRPGAGTAGRLTAALLFVLGSVLGGLALGAGPAAASPLPLSRCTAHSGVVLAVDFGHWGGPLLRSCGTTPTTGYALLNQGGWQTTGTGHDGPAFICRIGYGGYQGGRQFPTPAQDPCVLTPPASAYWSYWHADPGQSTWSYSRLGATGYHPRPGSVDLWTFGGTDIAGTRGRPAFSPDTVRARGPGPGGAPHTPAPHTPAGPAPKPTKTAATAPAPAPASHPPTHTPARATSAPARRPGGPAAPSASPGTSHTASPTASAPARGTTGPPASASASEPAVPSAAPASSGSAPPVVDAAPTAAARHSSGSAVPVAVTAAVVAAVGGATFVRVRRRRRAE